MKFKCMYNLFIIRMVIGICFDFFEEFFYEGNQGVLFDIWFYVLVKGQIDGELFL